MYITKKDKKYIKNYCQVQIENKELIRVKSLMCLLDKQYATGEIIEYIREDLKVPKDKIFHGEAFYTSVLPRGHIQLSNQDLYYPNCYLHQYVVSMELDIPMEEVQKYVVHHVDMNKANNSIDNLFIFYDVASHTAYHMAIKHGKIDMYNYARDYIDSIINKDNATAVKEYLKILDKKIKKICL